MPAPNQIFSSYDVSNLFNTILFWLLFPKTAKILKKLILKTNKIFKKLTSDRGELIRKLYEV